MSDSYLKDKKKVKKSSNVSEKSLPPAIIVDLDGTVALKTERKFYEYDRVDEDILNVPVANIVKKHIHDDNLHIIYLSGREDYCLEMSKKWLVKHELYHEWSYMHIYMRKSKDNRQDSIVKKEIYEAEIKGKYEVLFVLDDRQQVVDMWRAEGLTCLQVASGNF